MAEEGAEFAGRTVEDAVRAAETQLGTSRTELEIEIITAGRSGVFGIGAEQARVRARRPQPIAVAAPESVPVQFEASPSPHDTGRETESASSDYSESWAESEADEAGTAMVRDASDLPIEAAEVLRELLRTMGFDAEVTVRSLEDPIMLAITGSNLGVLIGRRGDNLASLQFMVNLILSRNRRQWPRVVIDVENYRARREESLRSLADRIAYRVRRNGRPFTLEAMPAGDRRVIHLSLREQEDIETYSIGEGVSRRVVIAPKKPVAPVREYR